MSSFFLYNINPNLNFKLITLSIFFCRLQLDRKVLDHDLPRKPVTLTIHFFVKFFIESISHLTENRTVELFYLQARSLIFRGTLEVESDIVFQLAALSLQVNSYLFKITAV
jgi:hypothetical protein